MGKKYYKGFNRDMTCRGFKFEEGKEYTEETAELCHSGFHACENPLDTFGYYAPGSSVYHEVELDGVSDERGDDSKVCARTIRIGAKLDVAGICKAHFEYVKAHCKPANGRVAGDHESASAGNWGSASAGECGSASAGDWGSASAGECGSASAGEYGSASAGNWGSASAGEHGIACCRGGKVKGGMGAMIAACEVNANGENTSVAAAIVDGQNIKPDCWYEVKNGKFVEVKDNG